MDMLLFQREITITGLMETGWKSKDICMAEKLCMSYI
jgi:predicted lipid carrier protein YhbT